MLDLPGTQASSLHGPVLCPACPPAWTLLTLHPHRMGGIPAVNGRGERLLLHIGIIDILQSYRCTAGPETSC